MAGIGKFMEDHLFLMIEEKADKTDIDRIEKNRSDQCQSYRS